MNDELFYCEYCRQFVLPSKYHLTSCENCGAPLPNFFGRIDSVNTVERITYASTGRLLCGDSLEITALGKVKENLFGASIDD